MTASTGSPSAMASESRLSTTTPQPSPRTKPSARGVEGLAAAVGRHHAPLARATTVSGDSMTLTPPASARSLSRLRRLWHARWMATSDDEQAVSTATLGPRRSSRNDRRLAMMQCALPVSGVGVDRRRGRRLLAVAVVVHGWRRRTRRCGCRPGGRRAGRRARAPRSPPRARRRCCGSMRAASRGEMPKNAASNWSMPSRKPPHVASSSPGAAGSGRRRRRRPSGRRGLCPMASTPSREELPERLGESAPPGKPAAHADDGDRLAAEQAVARRAARGPAWPAAPASPPTSARGRSRRASRSSRAANASSSVRRRTATAACSRSPSAGSTGSVGLAEAGAGVAPTTVPRRHRGAR